MLAPDTRLRGVILVTHPRSRANWEALTNLKDALSKFDLNLQIMVEEDLHL